MTIAKWLLLGVLTLPVLELVVFLAVVATIGFGWTLLLLLSTSLTGFIILHNAGGRHITRMRVALAEGRFTSLHTDGAGGLTLLAGFLLLIPGFITDTIGIVLLTPALRRALVGVFGHGAVSGERADGVVDLEPKQWRREEDRDLSLPNNKSSR